MNPVNHHWTGLKQFTRARIALGRSGTSLPTEEILNFALAHAQAKDAIHHPLDDSLLISHLNRLGLKVVTVKSHARNRSEYLRRPDLGRQLHPDSFELLKTIANKPYDLTIIIADGLSSHAVHKQAIKLLEAFLPLLHQLGFNIAPIILAHQARVALGDSIGILLHTKNVIVLIGERPGLSSPDSLGAYMTWHPDKHTTDADRNCISNIRPEGLSYQAAAFKLAWLLEQSFSRKLSGVELKDESNDPTIPSHLTPILT